MSISSTKTELIHEASRMLLSKGLNGLTLQELADSLKIKKASLFYHFPSKNHLAVELFRFYQESFILWAREHENLPPEKMILAYADQLTSWICKKDRICPVGALSLEWHLVDSQIQQEIKKLHRLHQQWLTGLYKKIPIRISVQDAVFGTMSLLQGSIQLARINNKPELLKKNLKTYLKCIKEQK